MTIDDKRKTIEVLLCTAGTGPLGGGSIETTHEICRGLEYGEHCTHAAEIAWSFACFATLGLGHGRTCLEAAYLLIESSPALRRDWFGTP